MYLVQSENEMLLAESRIITALKKAVRASPADETLIAAQRGTRKTLRFAGGRIHQSFHEEEVPVWVKVACNGRMGIATTCSLSYAALRRAIDSAMTIARVAAKQLAPAFSTTPQMAMIKPTTYFPQTIQRPLQESIQTIRRLWTESQSQGMELAGSFVVGEDELAIIGSRGLTQYQPFSIAGIRLVATRGKDSGFAAQASRDLDALDLPALAQRAWKFCRMNKNPKPIPIGRYDVLLEPEAVAELMEWLGYIGFGAKQFMERTSFLSGRIGERLMDRRISISDDGSDSEGLCVPFDYEGIPKQRVALVDRGIAAGVVYDSHYGKLHRRESTGHAGPYDEFEGPLATNLFMAPGPTAYGDLLPMMDRGLWICRFHYVNGLLKTREALMTGLTRDGTFLIRNGKVAGAVKNLRFTQSTLEAFSKIVAVSRERQLIADPAQGLSSTVAPALLIKDFTFTGQTQ